MWHGHSGGDRSEGLAGPLIVRPKKGAAQPVGLPYDEERTLFLGDWWHTSELQLLASPVAGGGTRTYTGKLAPVAGCY